MRDQIHEKYMRNTWDIHEQIHMKYMRNTWTFYETYMSKYIWNTWEIHGHFTSVMYHRKMCLLLILVLEWHSKMCYFIYYILFSWKQICITSYYFTLIKTNFIFTNLLKTYLFHTNNYNLIIIIFKQHLLYFIDH